MAGDYIGKPFAEVDVPQLLKDSGCRFERVIRPNTMITAEINQKRLNIYLDSLDRVVKVRTG